MSEENSKVDYEKVERRILEKQMQVPHKLLSQDTCLTCMGEKSVDSKTLLPEKSAIALMRLIHGREAKINLIECPGCKGNGRMTTNENQRALNRISRLEVAAMHNHSFLEALTVLAEKEFAGYFQLSNSVVTTLEGLSSKNKEDLKRIWNNIEELESSIEMQSGQTNKRFKLLEKLLVLNSVAFFILAAILSLRLLGLI